MYEKSITRSARALFVIAIDQSGSMAGCIDVAGRKTTKADMVVEVANDLIAELVERSRRSDGVRNYYDVAVVGYSGDGVTYELGEEWVSVPELEAREVEVREIEREYTLEDGAVRFFRHKVRRWIKSKAKGTTPMHEALYTIYELVGRWCCIAQNRHSFPPIIFNITDGVSSDCDYRDIVEISEKIKGLSTLDGGALLVNIHITSLSSKSTLLFPSAEEFEAWSAQCSSASAQALYESASVMPQLFADALCDIKGSGESREFRAMSYNSSMSELISILNIGSISVKRG